MAFDYKKEYKGLYLPKNKPEIITVPEMQFLAVRGSGNPNEAGGAYQDAISALYQISYAIRMSYKSNRKIEGYFEYVVPPLEGFWWQDGMEGIDYAHKEAFQWISVIRLPDFVTKSDFDWAVEEAAKKKKADCSKVEFFTYNEGLCVQCMHLGPYDAEPATVAQMVKYADHLGYDMDITTSRYHHEIYLNDARKCAPEKLKTVIRHPVKKR